jgi:hypothetical protein
MFGKTTKSLLLMAIVGIRQVFVVGVEVSRCAAQTLLSTKPEFVSQPCVVLS